MGRRSEQTKATDRARRAAQRREANPHLGPYVPRGPQGHPPTPHLHGGLELAGQSVNSDGAGKLRGVWDLGRKAPEPNPEPIPPDFAAKKIATFTVPGGERGRWTSYDRSTSDLHTALMAAWDRHAEQYEGRIPPAPAPERTRPDTLTLYPIGDHHLGMLAWAPETGEHWDHRHGIKSLKLAVRELVGMTPPSERVVLANLGDFLHAQDDANVTPGHGNRLDVDGRHAKIADMALALLTSLVDELLTHHAHVEVLNLPGNHDPRVASALARELRAWYRNEPRITIAAANAAHQYVRFGANLLGFHHGDRTPGVELPSIMAVDMATAWAECLYRYWHCGHVHHKSRDKEHPGVIVETHRILPPGDAWHAGRYRASRGMSAITYDRDHGECSRVTVNYGRIAETVLRELGFTKANG